MCAYRIVATPNFLLTHSFVTTRGANMACVRAAVNFRLIPRRSGGGAKEKNAWYTLFTHVFIFRRISEKRIFPPCS